MNLLNIGVLGGGCVQEEILFVIKPECLVSMLICSKMEANEAIIITGTQQFSKYRGYGFTFKFDGNNQDTTPWDEGYNCYKNHIIAVDATTSFRQQFNENLQNRDINKLYIGVKDLQTEESQPLSRPVYVTGHWGCGAFGGDKQLKAVQQIISASEAGVDLIYSIFNERVFGEEFTKLLQVFVENEVTVGELYTFLLEYQPTDSSSLFGYICSKIIENRKNFQKVTTSDVEKEPFPLVADNVTHATNIDNEETVLPENCSTNEENVAQDMINQNDEKNTTDVKVNIETVD